MKTRFPIVTMTLSRFLVILLLLAGISRAGAQHLVINEFSQGNTGAREYIELVVVGTRTCSGDSCADIRGWIIDDNNGWCGAGAGQGIATGHMRFSNDPNWSCVPYGSIILLYNSGDVNPSITLADDPTDANNDNVYVVPSTSLLLENTTATPVSPSSTTYVYPAVAYAAGGSWNTVGLANGGDAVIITDPANLSVAHHSIAYGSVSGGTATVYKSQSGAGKVYYLTDDQYTAAASYSVGDAPADETPGAPNGTANAAWIAGMLASPGGAVVNTIAACINPGGSYVFNGTTLTAGGVYYDTLTTASLCDSVIQLNLSLITPQSSSVTISSCNFVVYHGNTYTSSAVVNDTVFSVHNCDSIYEQAIISITPLTPVAQLDTVSGCQNIVYKGVAYTTSQVVTDTLKTLSGCDSIYRHIYLNVVPDPVVTITPSDPTVCRGVPVTLTASSGSGPVQWIGYPPGASITVTPEITTSYSAQVSNELNCVGVAYSTVYIEDFNMALDYAPRPAEHGSLVTLSSSANMNYTVQEWGPAAVFGNSLNKSQTITADQPMYVTVVGRNDKGCVDTARVYMEVLPVPRTFLPTAFSPNGDGLNDYFGPVFIRDYHVKNFSIFNRWGQRVFQAISNTQLGNGWDGRFNGTACDPGTYYYLLQAEDPRGKVQELKGDVTLVH